MAEVKQFDSKNKKSVGAGPQLNRAKFAYPYFNMKSSLDVARLIYEKGGGSCTPDQLAAFLDYKSVKSGTYQTRTSASRQFGFVQSGGGEISITERAQNILNPVMPEDAILAKTEAFLAVELFNQIYQQFQGKTLPPGVGLKNLFTQMYNLTNDRVGPAIRVFFQSAEYAGFFATGGNRSRLIKPPINISDRKPNSDIQMESQPQNEGQQKPKWTGGGGGEPPGVHSAIIGLLRELPAPGNTWKKSKKDAFKTAFAATLDFIYPTDDEAIGE